MIAEELINDMIPALTMKDSAEKAILWMEELRTKLLPVIDHGQFRGFVTEEAIFENNDIDKEISSIRLAGENCYVKKSRHFFDIIKLLRENNVDMAAIVGDDSHYLGVVTAEDIMKAFYRTAVIQNPGAIIVLSMRQIDYTMTEIVRLIEENNAKILGTFTHSDPQDNNNILITLKINTQDLTRISATLERFGYNIIARFQEAPDQFSSLERLDLLMKYINI
jgi:signal-transduction protein with cAMP-binding, CBS, and nucleotidyltransferase domain